MKRRVLLYRSTEALVNALEAIPGWRSSLELIPCRPGKTLVEQMKEERPALLLLDVDTLGHETKRVVADTMRAAPLPILLLSDFAHDGPEAVIDALGEGAKGFVESPLAARGARGHRRRDVLESIEATLTRRTSERSRGLAVVVVGVSTGGPSALGTLLAGLPGDLPAAVLIVQHMPARFTGALADRLNTGTRLSVREAVEGDAPAPGTALVAPGGRHLELDARARVALYAPGSDARFVPSIDLTMVSAAHEFGAGAIGVLLTGMGKDGILGLRAIRAAGGRTLAQDEASSVVYGMPKAAAELGLADSIVPLDDLAGEIERQVRRTDRLLRRTRSG